MNDENKSPESESSVWASYSDLFTNVAIIFLVMFVFSLIKATMSQMKVVIDKRVHEEEMKGKLSEKEMQKNKDRMEKVTQVVDEMKTYESVIDDKIKMLNQYAAKLQENKVILKEVLEAQAKQEMVMKAAEEKLREEEDLKNQKQFALEEANLRIKLLNDELSRAQLEVKQREEIYQKSLVSKNEKALNQEKEFKDTVESLKSKLVEAQADSEKIKSDLEKRASERQAETTAMYEKRLQEISKSLDANNSQIQNLSKEKESLSSDLASLAAAHGSLKKQYESLDQEHRTSLGDSQKLSAKYNDVFSKLQAIEGEASRWKGEFDKKVGETGKLKDQLADAQKRFSDLAHTMTKLKDTVKNNVALELSEKFKDQGLGANVNLKTGEVVLLSGEGFNFEKGSAKLSKEAKITLKKIIPVYASVLFSDKKVYSQITSISMEGHSSPSFGGKYVDPMDKQTEAYAYNMRLSAMRAASVANYLMSKEIGEYPHKDQMKVLLHAVGFGYMKPVTSSAQVRMPASTDSDCGPWSCLESQRVQINFLLRDNMEEIQKIIDANGGIK